jgi:hypothetical protein
LRLLPDVIAATATRREKNRTHNRASELRLFRHSLNTRQPHRCRARDDAFAFSLPFRREQAALLA